MIEIVVALLFLGAFGTFGTRVVFGESVGCDALRNHQGDYSPRFLRGGDPLLSTSTFDFFFFLLFGVFPVLNPRASRSAVVINKNTPLWATCLGPIWTLGIRRILGLRPSFAASESFRSATNRMVLGIQSCKTGRGGSRHV